MTRSVQRRHQQLAYTVIVCLILAINCNARSRGAFDGRYSYSLSTFDATGRLGQVQYSIAAANMGTPVVAIATDSDINMIAPEVVSSPFIMQDGTARFTRITSDIILTHSGLSADGRVLAAAAQRLAVEHEYTFDEEIQIEIFLQEMSLLLQEFTMKPAARPFGATLLIGYNPRKRNRSCTTKMEAPILYRIDPSGTITKGKVFVVNQVMEGTDLLRSLEATAAKSSDSNVQEQMLQALQQSLMELERKQNVVSSNETLPFRAVESFLAATLASDGSFRVTRNDWVV